MAQSSNAHALVVPAGSPATNAPGLRPAKGLVEVPNPWGWLGWLILGLVLVVLAWLAWKRRKPATTTSALAIPPLPAHLRARARLMDAMSWIAQPKPFCVAVSDALREYLEESLNLRAPDRTTEEFLEELQASAKLSRDQKRVLAQFLERCDLVKFARDEPSRSDLEGLHTAALQLIDQTAPVAVAPTAEMGRPRKA